MRIGELAALIGVSTRTVRHYHHLGLLPEPTRLANGYREYRSRDAIALARVRRLAELGLSLDEIRDALADDQGRELREVLMELDADLARQQEAIGARRARLATLLAETDLDADSTVSPDMAAVLRALYTEGSRFAEADREFLALMDTAADPADRDAVLGLMRPLTDPAALAEGHALYARLDEIAEADPGDPQVAALAADVAAHIPPELAAAMIGHLPAETEDGGQGGVPWQEMLADELTPAQAEVFRQAMRILAFSCRYSVRSSAMRLVKVVTRTRRPRAAQVRHSAIRSSTWDSTGRTRHGGSIRPVGRITCSTNTPPVCCISHGPGVAET
jgi:DNA-binding transcriptional MerR regulator